MYTYAHFETVTLTRLDDSPPAEQVGTHSKDRCNERKGDLTYR